jgi:hypothetical protein
VILGGMLITIFDRVVLSQMTFFVRWLGRTTGVHALTVADLTLWRWFFFGLGLVLVMLLSPRAWPGAACVRWRRPTTSRLAARRRRRCAPRTRCRHGSSSAPGAGGATATRSSTCAAWPSDSAASWR